MVLRVYEPPASRFAGRVPLLLAQKGEVRVVSRFPGSSGWMMRPLGSRLRGNDGGFARIRRATGMLLLVYGPPASRFARRVPLLRAQKGEVRVVSRLPGLIWMDDASAGFPPAREWRGWWCCECMYPLRLASLTASPFCGRKKGRGGFSRVTIFNRGQTAGRARLTADCRMRKTPAAMNIRTVPVISTGW